MGFFKKLFGGSYNSEASRPEQNLQDANESDNIEPAQSVQNYDGLRYFFGIDLKSSPNSDWDESEGEYNSEGQSVRNFELCLLPDSYFTEIDAKVIGKNATNFFFTCPYSYEDAFDIYFIIERDIIHHGRYTNTEAARKFRGKFDSEYDMINWDNIDGCSIMMNRDTDTGDIKLGVWTNFYNAQYLDEENPINESNITSQELDKEGDETENGDNTAHMYYEMRYLVDPEEYDYRHKTIMDGTINFSVVGMQHRDNYEKLMEIIEEGTLVVLKPEPDNPYDSNALAFYLKDGTLIGYLPKKDQPFARIFLAQGQMEGEICEVDDKWLDTEFVLTPDIMDASAFEEGEVRLSKVTCSGLSSRSQSIGIEEFIISLE